jgi:L-threonylcarbamoyladenylate synthase
MALAAELLRSGGLVAMPTETVYGLAADALNEAAVSSIFAAKQRPGLDPLIVHVCDRAMLSRVVREIPPAAHALMEHFWPGPLTLLLPRHPDLPLAVTAGRDLVGVRMPSHPVALTLIRDSGQPLAAPSANLFGHISPTAVAHVMADLNGRIDAVLDGGPSQVGVESTVFDPVARVLYRQGGVSPQQIETVLGFPIEIYNPVHRQENAPESLPSPGVGIRHYAPGAKLVLVDTLSDLQKTLTGANPATTAVMLPKDWEIHRWTGKVFAWERWDDAPGLARTLYGGLGTLDAFGVATIVCPLPAASDEPLVEAIRDRLLKAARDA